MVLALLALLDNNELKVWQMFSHLLNENNSSCLTWLLVGSKLGDISVSTWWHVKNYTVDCEAKVCFIPRPAHFLLLSKSLSNRFSEIWINVCFALLYHTLSLRDWQMPVCVTKPTGYCVVYFTRFNTLSRENPRVKTFGMLMMERGQQGVVGAITCQQ